MKKKIIILIIIIALAAIGVGGYLILRNARTIPEGKYMIKNYAEYPDAYAIVQERLYSSLILILTKCTESGSYTMYLLHRKNVEYWIPVIRKKNL